MIISTRDFGELTINEDEIITMSTSLFGFSDEKKFVLLIDDESDGMFNFLQSTTNPQLSFILTDPSLVFAGYSPKLTKETKKQLGINADCPAVFRVITVIPDDFTKSTANLKSPVVICPQTRRAAQIILDEDYPLRAPLCETEG